MFYQLNHESAVHAKIISSTMAMACASDRVIHLSVKGILNIGFIRNHLRLM
jgi:hypothetical protein